MRSRKRSRTVPGLVAVATLLLSSAGAADGFVFLRNTHNPSARLNRSEVRAVFTGRTKVWPSGDVVQVILTPEGAPEMKWLAETAIGIGEPALRTKIKQESFKGEMRTPISVPSVQGCIAELKDHPGGICAADASGAARLPTGVAVTGYAGE